MDIAPKKAKGRPTRQRVGVKDRLVIINRDPEKAYRLVNSDPARVYQMQQLGYNIEQVAEHVPAGLRTSLPTTTDNVLPVGGGQTQVLMSIPKDLYEEIHREKLDEVDKMEEGIQSNKSEGQYGTISIQK